LFLDDLLRHTVLLQVAPNNIFRGTLVGHANHLRN
jgi:small nuclear ribonucleoprotein (snRNP)-like protein